MPWISEFRGVLTGLALVGIALLVAVDLPAVVPGQDLLQSLRFHIDIGLMAMVALLFIGRAWWRGLVMLIAVVASIGQGAWVIYGQQILRQDAEHRPAVEQANILSFNVLADNLRGADIADYVLETGPDIAVIMEANAIIPQLDRLAAKYPGRAGCAPDGDNCDLMVFSREPMLSMKVIPLPPFGRLRLVLARTTIRGEPVTIVGAHLSKPYFDEASWVELGEISRTLTYAKGRVIVAGDFNAAAWSRQVADMVKLSQLVPPPYYPATWPIRAGALGVPIDNMFVRGDIRIDTIEALADSIGSNHRGLLARMSLLAP